MIIIADSGSTKVHWSLMTANGHHSDFFTDGINPMFQSVEQIESCLNAQLLPQLGRFLWAGTLTSVFFYGAGCTPEKKVLVAEALSHVFPKADIQVASDMLGAARGLLGRQPGIACILGTGSGSCFYDGVAVSWAVPSLGYVLGDEGSGATLGRRLVGDILKNQLGQDLKELFLSEYSLNQADILDHVYKQPFPNRWLASLSRFCAEHIDDERIYRLVYTHFSDFVHRNLDQYDKLPVGFVGSIAYYYRDVLSQVMSDNGYTLAHILLDPVDRLRDYHSSDCVPTT